MQRLSQCHSPLRKRRATSCHKADGPAPQIHWGARGKSNAQSRHTRKGDTGSQSRRPAAAESADRGAHRRPGSSRNPVRWFVAPRAKAGCCSQKGLFRADAGPLGWEGTETTRWSTPPWASGDSTHSSGPRTAGVTPPPGSALSRGLTPGPPPTPSGHQLGASKGQQRATGTAREGRLALALGRPRRPFRSPAERMQCVSLPKYTQPAERAQPRRRWRKKWTCGTHTHRRIRSSDDGAIQQVLQMPVPVKQSGAQGGPPAIAADRGWGQHQKWGAHCGRLAGRPPPFQRGPLIRAKL